MRVLGQHLLGLDIWSPGGDPEELLAEGEKEVPEAVRRTLGFFRACGVQVKLSRNLSARSCRDAARKRLRLGQRGIALADEMKTFLGTYPGKSGNYRWVMLHCRGHQDLDLERAADVLGADGPIGRLDARDLMRLGMQYGTVNPFSLHEQGRIQHIYDWSLMERRGVPGTVMTNAGDPTWAVEFFPDALIHAQEDAEVADIADDGPEVRVERAAPMGLLTSSGAAARALWASIESGVRELLGNDFRGDVSLPAVAVRVLPAIGLDLELDHRQPEVWAALRDGVLALADQGCEHVALCNHAAHAYHAELRDLCERRGMRFVSQADAVVDSLRAEGVQGAVLLGLDPAATADPRSPYVDIEDLTLQGPSPSGLDAIRQLALRVQREGPNEGGRQKFRDLVQSEAPDDSAVVLAQAELTLLYRSQRRPGRSGRVVVDALEAYGQSLARLHVEGE